MTLEFIHDSNAIYGKVLGLKPHLHRLTAKNPSPFTYTGTGTYIVGGSSVAVIDPGPIIEEHIEGIIKALEGKTLSHIIITHTHLDHSPAAIPLAKELGASILAFGPHGIGKSGGVMDEEVEEGADKNFKPTRILKDSEYIEGEGWTLKAIHTPGHTSNHMCFLWIEENVLFTGDHIMGWSTSIVSPPDGDMGAYMASLEKIKAIGAKVLYPTHGPAINNSDKFIDELIKHRLNREKNIYEAVKAGHNSLQNITKIVYTHIGPGLIRAAERNTLAHLIYLIEQGNITSDIPPSPEAMFEVK